MSRTSDAKKARRKKRRAAQGSPQPMHGNLIAAEDDPLAVAVADLDEWLAGRGWLLEDQNSVKMVSWAYPPSAAEFDDEDREPVTRVWLTVDEDDEQVVMEFGAVLVGADGADGGAYVLDPDTLVDDVPALEAYRPGLAQPKFL